jgi:regulator of chromosome condensation
LPDSIGKNIVSVSAGLFHSIFLDITGRHIYTCGRCDSGQLGLQESTYEPGDFRNRLQKVLFDEADPEEDLEFKSIAAGENSSFAVTRTGKLYSWGFGEMGQLGHGKEADQLQATPISNFVKVGFVLEVSSGSQHTIVLANRDMIKS